MKESFIIDELDLHGVGHYNVELKIENFVLTCDFPARIITGNSVYMQSAVKKVLKKHKLTSCFENDWNLGSLIIKED